MFRTLAVLVTTLVALRAGAADARLDAAALDRQAQRFEAEGRFELAAELADEAIRLQPEEPGYRLRAGDLAFARGRCEAALSHYAAWRSRERAPAADARARVEARTARCELVARTRLSITTERDADCSVDEGPAIPFVAGASTIVPVAPGGHTITCVDAAGVREEIAVSLAPGDRAEFRVAFPAAPTAPAAPVEAPSDPLPPPPPPGDEVPVVPPEEAPAAEAPGAVLVHADGPGWSCRLDDGPSWLPDLSSEILLEAPPGPHRLRCEHPTAASLEEAIVLVAGERIERAAQRRRPTARPVLPPPTGGAGPAPRRPAPVPAAPAPPPPPAPAPATPATASTPRGEPPHFEPFVGGGFGPSSGAFGIHAGARLGPVELAVGSGVLPFAATASFLPAAGRTGPFVSVGYVRLGRGVFVGGSGSEGNAGFALGGLEVRAVPHLRVRLGGGVAAGASGGGIGPLVVEASAAWVP